MREIYKLFKDNFPYIRREEGTHEKIIENDDNIIFEKRNDNNKLIGCAIVNKNTILLLVVDKDYRK